MKLVNGHNADSLAKIYKIMFAEYKLKRIIMSNAETNFVSEKFWEICRHLNIHQVISSPYNYQSNGQAEAC